MSENTTADFPNPDRRFLTPQQKAAELAEAQRNYPIGEKYEIPMTGDVHHMVTARLEKHFHDADNVLCGALTALKEWNEATWKLPGVRQYTEPRVPLAYLERLES